MGLPQLKVKAEDMVHKVLTIAVARLASISATMWTNEGSTSGSSNCRTQSLNAVSVFVVSVNKRRKL